MPLPLTLAQEPVAVEAGFDSWAALKNAAAETKRVSKPIEGTPTPLNTVPILFVRDVRAAADLLVRQAWGGIDFHVRDIDGNVIAFVEYREQGMPFE